MFDRTQSLATWRAGEAPPVQFCTSRRISPSRLSTGNIPTHGKASPEGQEGSHRLEPARPAAARSRRLATRQTATDVRAPRARYRRQIKKLFSKAHLREAAEIASDIKREWGEASVKVGGDAKRLDALKASARAKFQRQLARALPNYREAQALRRGHLSDVRKLFRSNDTGVRAGIAWGEFSPESASAQEFVPPYSAFDVLTIDPGDFVRYDESFVSPPIGHMVNNIVYDQDEDTSFYFGLFGLLGRGVVSNRVSCGVTYSLPASGRLQISAVIQNFYNKVMYSVHDNFGFSSALLSIRVRLFIAVVQGSKIIYLAPVNTLLVAGIQSFGHNLSYSTSEIDNSVPYTVTGVTEKTFNANESVQVLAGSDVYIKAELDDMQARVNAVLWWQLKKLIVDVV